MYSELLFSVYVSAEEYQLLFLFSGKTARYFRLIAIPAFSRFPAT